VRGVCEGQCTAGATVPLWVYSTQGTCSRERATNNACSATPQFVYHTMWTKLALISSEWLSSIWLLLWEWFWVMNYLGSGNFFWKKNWKKITDWKLTRDASKTQRKTRQGKLGVSVRPVRVWLACWQLQPVVSQYDASACWPGIPALSPVSPPAHTSPDAAESHTMLQIS